MSEAHAYTMNRWDCPECGEVNETDVDLDVSEECAGCHTEVTIT